MQTLIEYTPRSGTDPWKVELFDEFSKRFNVSEKNLPDFHAAVCSTPPFNIIRRIYGIHPINRPLSCDPDDFRVLTIEQLSVQIGMAEKQIESTIQLGAAIWNRVRPSKKRTASPSVTSTPKPKPQKEKIEKQDDEYRPVTIAPSRYQIERLDVDSEQLLLSHGYSDECFTSLDRPAEEAESEKKWFSIRLRDVSDFFDDPSVYALIREALANELALRRINSKMMRMEVDSARYADMQTTKLSTERSIRDNWEQISIRSPKAASKTKRVNVQGTISGMIDAVKEYESDGTTELIDGVFNAYEVQVLLRESVQHEVRYRFGQVVALNDAMANLWNPKWKRSFNDYQLKQLDAGFKGGCAKLREETNVQVPDLTGDGPRSEYPPIHTPTDDQLIDDIAEPGEAVALDDREFTPSGE